MRAIKRGKFLIRQHKHLKHFSVENIFRLIDGQGERKSRENLIVFFLFSAVACGGKG